jgi:hypothetical protein
LSLSFLFFPSFFSLFLFFEPSWASLYFGLVKWLFFIVLTNFLTHAMSHIKLFFKTLKKVKALGSKWWQIGWHIFF